MISRYTDWLKQGQRDLAHARRALDGEDDEWAFQVRSRGRIMGKRPA